VNQFDDRYISTYQDMIATELRSSRRRPRRSGPAGVRRFLARALVLTGARLMPETPVIVGGRVLVFEPTADPEDHGLQPAA
jgi:hypothetical protein